MNIKPVFVYDHETRQYIGESFAQECQFSPGTWLTPDYSVDTRPHLNSDGSTPEGKRNVLSEDGVTWTLEDVLQPAPGEIVTPTPEEIAIKVTNKIESLWSSADAVVSGSISGVALSILTIGVLQSKPKALAVAQWSKSIWTEYYVRKALVTATSEDDLDFSSFGPMPYTVPELQDEINL